MLHTVTERQFMALMVEKEQARPGRDSLVIPAFTALAFGWMAVLPPLQANILTYLIGRTFGSGRLAVRVAMGEFMGDRGLNASRNSIRSHLRMLCESGLLEIYRTFSEENGSEKESRMFEINCKKLFEKLEIVPEMPQNSSQKSDTHGQNLTTPSYIHSMYMDPLLNKDKSLYSARSSRSGSRGDNVLSIPKKPRAVVQTTSSAMDAIRNVQGLSRVTAAKRVESAAAKPAHMIDKLEMQAIIDKAQKRLAPSTTRMVVTNKEFGLLRRRMKEQAPASFTQFVNWLFTYWGTVSLQHRTALKRNADRAARGETGIPASPDFHALAYRYPYFLKAHANFLAERTDTTVKAEKDEEKARLESALRTALREKAMLRTELVKAKETPVLRRTRPAAPVAASVDTGAVDLPDADLPEWTTRSTFGARK